MTGIMFNVPNLDCESIDPADYEQLALVLRSLANYSESKAQAKRLRLTGDIQNAMRIERKNGTLYRLLPDWARW